MSSQQQDTAAVKEIEGRVALLRRILQRRYPPFERRFEEDKNNVSDDESDASLTLLAADVGKERAEVLINAVLQPLLPSSASQDTDQPTRPSLHRCDRQRLLLAYHYCQYFHRYFPPAMASPSLAEFIQTRGLDFQDIELSEEDCQAINSVLHHHHSSMAIVNFHFSRMGDAGYEILAPGLSKCRNLQCLHLDGNRLSDRHAPHIASIIHANRGTLRTVTVASNLITGGGSLQLHMYTDFCLELRGIALSGSDSSAAVTIANITKILRACPLQVLSLHNCAIGNNVLSALELFRGTRMLTGLDLVKAGLDGGSASAMSRVLESQQGTIVALGLSGNDLGDDFLRAVGPALARCQHLVRLSLQDAGLSSASLAIVASFIGACQSLKQLRLAGNHFGDPADDESARFASAARASLSLLEMPEEKLVDPTLLAMLRADSGGVQCTVEYVSLDAYMQAAEAEREEKAGKGGDGYDSDSSPDLSPDSSPVRRLDFEDYQDDGDFGDYQDDGENGSPDYHGDDGGISESHDWSPVRHLDFEDYQDDGDAFRDYQDDGENGSPDYHGDDGGIPDWSPVRHLDFEDYQDDGEDGYVDDL